jgi:transposase
MMSDPLNPLKLEVVGVLRNSRRRYEPASNQRLVEACLRPGVSVASVALQHGVNANLLRKWIARHQRQQRNGMAEGGIGRPPDVCVPVVEVYGVAGTLEPPVPPPIQHPVQRAKVPHPMGPAGSRLTVKLPNGVTLQLECSGQDVELVSAMILTLGRCDVPAGR